MINRFFLLTFLNGFLLLPGISQDKSKNNYLNEIPNKKLIPIIEDYVKRGKGTNADKTIQYLVLTLYQKDSIDTFTLRHADDADLRYCHQEPFTICSPIVGKKIIFKTKGIENYKKPNIDEAASFYKEEYPKIYKKNKQTIKERKKEERKRGLIMETTTHRSGRYLQIRFDNRGQLIDSTYFCYERIN